jgi:hypothetical protein
MPLDCQVEDVKTALLLYGNKTSQITKDILTDFHKLKPVSMTFPYPCALSHLSSALVHDFFACTCNVCQEIRGYEREVKGRAHMAQGQLRAWEYLTIFAFSAEF